MRVVAWFLWIILLFGFAGSVKGEEMRPTYSPQRRAIRLPQLSSNVPSRRKIVAPYATAGITAPTVTGNPAQVVDDQGALATQSTQGLGFSNSSLQTPLGDNAPTTISISFGAGMVLQNPNDGTTITLSAPISGQTLNSAINGVGGLDIGSPAGTGPRGSSIYYIFEIYDPVMQTASCLMSLSATSPELPLGYTYYRWIGATPWINAYFVPFIQNNYDLYFMEALSLFGSLTGTWPQTLDFTGQFPPNPYITHVIMNIMLLNHGNNVNVGLEVGNTNTLGIFTSFMFINAATALAGLAGPQFTMPILSAATVYYGKIGTGTGTVGLNVQGYRLNL
jgi:hypothetical protein